MAFWQNHSGTLFQPLVTHGCHRLSPKQFLSPHLQEGGFLCEETPPLPCVLPSRKSGWGAGNRCIYAVGDSSLCPKAERRHQRAALVFKW